MSNIQVDKNNDSYIIDALEDRKNIIKRELVNFINLGLITQERFNQIDPKYYSNHICVLDPALIKYYTYPGRNKLDRDYIPCKCGTGKRADITLSIDELEAYGTFTLFISPKLAPFVEKYINGMPNCESIRGMNLQGARITTWLREGGIPPKQCSMGAIIFHGEYRHNIRCFDIGHQQYNHNIHEQIERSKPLVEEYPNFLMKEIDDINSLIENKQASNS